MQVFLLDSGETCVYWETVQEDQGTTREAAQKTGASSIKFVPYQLDVSTAEPHWKMSFCHEIGHILLADHPDMLYYHTDDQARYHIEYLAWCLAKSFCKKEYWDEKQAVRLLDTYYGYWGIFSANFPRRESIEAISTKKEVMAYTTRREVIV